MCGDSALLKQANSISSFDCKRVTFSDDSRNETYEIDTISSLEENEIWYSSEEIESMAMKCYRIAEKMEKGIISEGKKHTFRGLEQYSLKIKNIISVETQIQAKKFVLKEQARQNRLCSRNSKTCYDEEIIANKYLLNGAVEKCQKAAIERGLQDEKCVQEMINKSNKKKRVHFQMVSRNFRRTISHAFKRI